MSKSGLADSPFFAPTQPKIEPLTPPSHQETENLVVDKNASPLPDSPTLEKIDITNSEAQRQENQDQKRSNERTFEPPNERLNERTIKQKREKIRHTFDIYRDQLVSLQMIQLEKVQAGKRKPKLGKMVADGIDLFIKQAASKKKQG
jgi:hypothetical protein